MKREGMGNNITVVLKPVPSLQARTGSQPLCVSDGSFFFFSFCQHRLCEMGRQKIRKLIADAGPRSSAAEIEFCVTVIQLTAALTHLSVYFLSFVCSAILERKLCIYSCLLVFL